MATNAFINSSNVSNLVDPNINNTLSQIKAKTFGDQVKEKSKEKLLSTTEDVKGKLKKDIDELIKKRKDLEINHQKRLLALKSDYDNNVEFQTQNNASQDVLEDLRIDYESKVQLENIDYEVSKLILEEEQNKKTEELKKLITDKYKKNKEKITQKKKELQEKYKTSKEERANAFKAKRQAVLKAAKKTIVPILVLLLADQLVKIASQTKRLQKLVNKTNNIIKAANTPEKINQARIARDNALKEIQNVESRIKKVSDLLKKIQTYVSIFGIVITIINLLPIPTSVPPGIGIPVNVITKLSATLEKANKIVLGLSAVLAIINPIISKILNNINKIRAQLLQINGLVDTKTAAIYPPELFNELLGQIGETEPGVVGTYSDYKGFKFAVKNEQNSQLIVKGNKRRYAVAIDRDNVEVLKSEASFTLDPQTLVDQLKLIIDERNLEA